MERRIYSVAFAPPGSTRSVMDSAAHKLLEKESVVLFAFEKRKHRTICFWKKKASYCLLLEKESIILFAFRKRKHLTIVSLKKRMLRVEASPLFKDVPSPRYSRGRKREDGRERKTRERERKIME